MESETTGEGNIPTVVTGVDLDAAADHAPVAIVDNLLSHTSSDKLDVDKENDIDRPVQETKHETHKTKPTILELSNNDHRHDPVAVKPCTSLSLELEKDLNHIPTSVSDNNSNTKDFVPKAHRPTEIDKKLNSCNETSSKLPETYGNADSCIHSGSQGNCYDCTNSRTENIVLTDTQSENTNSIIKTGRQTETKDPKNIMSDIENRTNEIKSEMDFNTKLGTLISNDTNKIMLENSTELSVDLNSSLEQKSCSDSSFPTSPLFANGINQGVINFGELTLLLKEYENLKEKHLNLQTEYTTVLEREKYLCAKLNEHDNEGDELCNKLTNVNSELREQLEKMMEELHAAKSENKRYVATRE